MFVNYTLFILLLGEKLTHFFEERPFLKRDVVLKL